MPIEFDSSTFVTTNLRSIVAANKSVEAHSAALGIEGDLAIQTWHLVASLSELCASHGVTLQAVLDDVNNHVRTGQITLPATAKILRKEHAAAPSKPSACDDRAFG